MTLILTWATVGWAALGVLSFDIVLACLTLCLLVGCERKPVVDRKARVAAIGFGCVCLLFCVWMTPALALAAEYDARTVQSETVYIPTWVVVGWAAVLFLFTLPCIAMPFYTPWDKTIDYDDGLTP